MTAYSGSTRRLVFTRSAAVIDAASTRLLLPQIARVQGAKVRVGLMLPYTGTFAQMGVAIENGVRMAIEEQGGKLGGCEIEWFKLDDESNPAIGVETPTSLCSATRRTCSSAPFTPAHRWAFTRAARNTGVLNLIPNASVHAATRALCAPNVFRTSFSNSQPTLALGKPMADRGRKRRCGSPGNTPQAMRR